MSSPSTISLQHHAHQPTIQRVVAVLWPSFLVAGLATILFFAINDPHDLWPDSPLGRLGLYSVGFFAFWGLGVMSSAMTCYFSRPCERVQNTKH
jgi:hypothetical protein